MFKAWRANRLMLKIVEKEARIKWMEAYKGLSSGNDVINLAILKEKLRQLQEIPK